MPGSSEASCVSVLSSSSSKISVGLTSMCGVVIVPGSGASKAHSLDFSESL